MRKSLSANADEVSRRDRSQKRHLQYPFSNPQVRRPAHGAAFTPPLAALVLLLFGAAIDLGCAARRPVTLEFARRPDPARVVILIPGMTGTRLQDRRSGRVLWGNARSLFFPRDGGCSLAVPVGPDSDRHEGIETAGPVTGFRILGFRFEAYGEFIRSMEANGYRAGDLESPRPDDLFFVFAYDWREGSVDSARRLAGLLDGLRKVRGQHEMRVALVAQSNASRIARWLIKYGGASLEEAEAGASGPPSGVRIEKLVLVGTANGGAMRTLRFMTRGRRYLPFGRTFLPEMFFTFPSTYEDLPVYRRDLFLDGGGRAVAVDPLDPEIWRRYGWSVYGTAAQRRLRDGWCAERLGTPEDRASLLARVLDVSRRLHHLLDQDVRSFGGVKYYSIQNAYVPTPDRAILVSRDGEWRTFFASDPVVKRDPYLRARAVAPGDGHAVLESQVDLSPQEEAAFARPTEFVTGGHFKMILNPAAQRLVLEFLLE
jgi:hypothetical protein